MCDLCSCFVHREIEIAPLERMVVTFVREREGENECGNAWNTHVRVTSVWLESDRGTDRIEINHHHLEGLGIFETVNTHIHHIRVMYYLFYYFQL